MSLAERLNASVRGVDTGPTFVFVHGFGCGQEMWRYVAPAFEARGRVVLLDLPGSGAADPASYDPGRHTSLEAYRDDVVALLRELELSDVVLVGHSVSSMISVLVQAAAPELVAALVLVAPSARYLDDEGYVGGFSATDIDDLLALMDRNHLGWQDPLSGLVAGAAPAEVRSELNDSFCRTKPEVAAQFAAVTFRGDNRADLAAVSVPTLILQVRDDSIAPMTAGEFVHDHIDRSSLEVIETSGHCPHLSAPDETVRAIAGFVESL